MHHVGFTVLVYYDARSTKHSVECFVLTHTNTCGVLCEHPEQAAFENLAGLFIFHYWASYLELKASANYSERDRKRPNGKKCKI
jgi:hypothetical protein